MRPFILILLALAACAPNTPPTIAAQTDQNLVLFRQGQHTLQEAFTFADTYCREKGRASLYRRTERVDQYSVMDHFECRSGPEAI